MKKMFTPFAVLLFLLFTSTTYSQIVWTFNDSLATPSFNSYSDVSAGEMTSNNNLVGAQPFVSVTRTSAGSQSYENHSGTFNLAAVAPTGELNTSASAYFEFTLTPSVTTAVIVNSIRFGMRSTSTGPQAIAVRSNLDGYLTNIVSDTITNNSVWVTKNFTGLVLPVGVGIPVTIRIYGYDGSGNPSAGTANWRIDDITLNSEVLPVSLNNFTASVISNKVLLNWTAANEVNLKGFSVEKSRDGRTFSEVSFVAASGKGNYSTQDAVSSSVVYYRLKTVNADGSFTYSKNIPVNASLSASSALRVYPNPVVNTAIVSHPQAGANASLTISDLSGRVLLNYPLQQNAVQTSVNMSKLMSGSYRLLYRGANGKTISTSVIKK